MTDPIVPHAGEQGPGTPALTGTRGSRARVARSGLLVPGGDRAVSVGEVLLIVALLISALVVVYLLVGENGTPAGAIPGALKMSGAAVRVVGDVNGLSASDTTLEGIPVRFPREDPHSLGACVVTLSTLVGDMGGIDMDRVVMTWTTGSSSVALPPLTEGPVEGPAWIIVSRSEFNPFQPEDGDRILEPGEQFTILIVAPEPVAPGHPFTVEIAPGGGGIPLTLERTVPPRVTPVMDLDG